MSLKPPVAPNTPSVPAAAAVTAWGNAGATRSVSMEELTETWVTGTLNANLTVTVTGRSGGVLRMFLSQDATGSRTLTVTDASDSSSLSVPITSTALASSVVTVWAPSASALKVNVE